MYHLAQINIGRMLAPLNDPVMAGFVEKLDELNALADSSPGFVWRLQTEDGDATSIRAFEDELILVNMSLWTSLETFANYAYQSDHREIMKQRRRWFERFNGPYMVLWWVPQGELPAVEDAKQRLDYLGRYGESPFAFSLKKPFSAPDAAGTVVPPIEEECPA